LDAEDRVLTDEINSFVKNVKDQRPSIKEDEFKCAINGLLFSSDANALDVHSSVRYSFASWLGDDKTNLIVHSPDNQAVSDRPYATRMRPLHKILLYHSKASLLKNIKTGSFNFLAPNLSLSYNASNDSYSFVMINKASILKYTDTPNCVATPVVLNAIREITQVAEDIVIKPAESYSYKSNVLAF
jgi:hypothetical protein